MSSNDLGDRYRFGKRIPILMAVDSSSADIQVGDFLVAATAGYVKQAAAGDIPVAVAMQNVASPTADGDVSVLADVSTEAVYEYPPDTGSVTQGLANTLLDLGGDQSIDIDASTDDAVRCHYVDTTANTVFISLQPLG